MPIAEVKLSEYFCAFDRSQVTQPPATKGPYSQVGFSYDGDAKEENQFSDADDNDDDDDDEEDDNDFNSDDSNDEGMDKIAKEFGVKRYGWLVYKDKRAKEEERRQKEVIKGDPSVVSSHKSYISGTPFELSSGFTYDMILIHSEEA